MFKKYKNWYSNLSPLKQLAVSFIINWFIWLIGSLLGDKVFFDEPHSTKYHLFYATWMAFIPTMFSNWAKMKTLFKSENNTTGSAQC
ncbi:hypothetical protein QTN47_16520 [Danxiaibacter flavus]|uniref:2TM domain-containing protein n=1 Tax=Danxiaibacter flavus TaxID=3049108 RepID=A0ABV3ZHZ5_9BACT|nr:hypothetical protein QNM32_16530 [Chitinophagaceae bacterium DXS]